MPITATETVLERLTTNRVSKASENEVKQPRETADVTYKQRNKKLKYVGGGHVISLILNVHNLLSWLGKCPTGTLSFEVLGWRMGVVQNKDKI